MADLSIDISKELPKPCWTATAERLVQRLRGGGRQLGHGGLQAGGGPVVGDPHVPPVAVEELHPVAPHGGGESGRPRVDDEIGGREGLASRAEGQPAGVAEPAPDERTLILGVDRDIALGDREARRCRAAEAETVAGATGVTVTLFSLSTAAVPASRSTFVLIPVRGEKLCARGRCSLCGDHHRGASRHCLCEHRTPQTANNRNVLRNEAAMKSVDPHGHRKENARSAVPGL